MSKKNLKEKKSPFFIKNEKFTHFNGTSLEQWEKMKLIL
jgi:hypothetical protein